MLLRENSDFLFGFEATLSNPNGDPDQENKPRMDYETKTVLVSDARRKRDSRNILKNKGYRIFVDTIGEQKVPMDKMFEEVIHEWFEKAERCRQLFSEFPELGENWAVMTNKDINQTIDFKSAYLDLLEEIKKKPSDPKKKQELEKKNTALKDFHNIFLTRLIQKSLIDIRLFGSAMAIEKITRTYTGPVQINWGYSLHPVELIKSNTITSIMNDNSSTFGKKHKLYYALIAHYGSINKYSASITGMSEEDRDLFRKSLVQGMMNNQTDSKQGQIPLFYLEVIYKPEFDGYLGDLRRFLKVEEVEIGRPIRSLLDLSVDFSELSKVISQMKAKDIVEKLVGWLHPLADPKQLHGIPVFDEEVDLWGSIDCYQGE